MSKSLFRAHIAESSSVQAHVPKMIKWIVWLVVPRVELLDKMNTYLIL